MLRLQKNTEWKKKRTEMIIGYDYNYVFKIMYV